jgi:hypothetical protein
MRAVSSSIMAALVVVALFWGNCYSCPQALLALAAHQPAHRCCHPTKTPKDCPAPTLHNYVKSATPHAPVLAPVAIVIQPEICVVSREIAFTTADYSPPDLLSLNSSFRI